MPLPVWGQSKFHSSSACDCRSLSGQKSRETAQVLFVFEGSQSNLPSTLNASTRIPGPYFKENGATDTRSPRSLLCKASPPAVFRYPHTNCSVQTVPSCRSSYHACPVPPETALRKKHVPLEKNSSEAPLDCFSGETKTREGNPLTNPLGETEAWSKPRSAAAGVTVTRRKELHPPPQGRSSKSNPSGLRHHHRAQISAVVVCSARRRSSPSAAHASSKTLGYSPLIRTSTSSAFCRVSLSTSCRAHSSSWESPAP